MIIPAIIHIPWVCISVIGFLRKGSTLGSISFWSRVCSCHLPIQTSPMALQVLWEQNQSSLTEITKILIQLFFSDFHYFPFLYLVDLSQLLTNKFLCFPDWVNYLKYILCNLPLSVYLSPGCSELKFHFLHEISPSSPRACHYQWK